MLEAYSIIFADLLLKMALFKKRNKEGNVEMSFIDHLEALRGHLFRSVIAIVLGGIVIGIYNDFFIKKVLMGPTHSDFPTYVWLCKTGKSLGLGTSLCMDKIGVKMQSTSVSGQFSMFFTVLIIGGIILAFPYILYSLSCLSYLLFCPICFQSYPNFFCRFVH